MTARRDSDRQADDQAAGAPSPDALLPALDDRQLRLLHQVGREWDHVTGDPQVWRWAPPPDPHPGSHPAPADTRPTRFGRFVNVARRGGAAPALRGGTRTREHPTPPPRHPPPGRPPLVGP